MAPALFLHSKVGPQVSRSAAGADLLYGMRPRPCGEHAIAPAFRTIFARRPHPSRGIFTQILGTFARIVRPSMGSPRHLLGDERSGPDPRPACRSAGVARRSRGKGRAESLRGRAESALASVPFSRFPWPCVGRGSFADGRRTITNASLELLNTATTAVAGRPDRKPRSEPLLLGSDNRIRHVGRSPP